MDARGRAAAGLAVGQVPASEVAVLPEPVGASNFLSGSPNFISGSMGVASPLLCRRVAGVADRWSGSLIYNSDERLKMEHCCTFGRVEANIVPHGESRTRVLRASYGVSGLQGV